MCRGCQQRRIIVLGPRQKVEVPLLVAQLGVVSSLTLTGTKGVVTDDSLQPACKEGRDFGPEIRRQMGLIWCMEKE